MSQPTSKATTALPRVRPAHPRPDGRFQTDPRFSLHPNAVARDVRYLLARVRRYFIESKTAANGRAPATSKAAARRAPVPVLLDLRERIADVVEHLAPALGGRRRLRCSIMSIAWCIDRLEGRPRAPWRNWVRHRHLLQHHLVWCRGYRLASAAASEELARRRHGKEGALRKLNLKRGPLGPVKSEHAGVRYGETSEGDYDLASPPPALALLVGRVLRYADASMLRECAAALPRDQNTRRDPRTFDIPWAVLATECIRLASAEATDRQTRTALAIAGVALSCLVASGAPRLWHELELDKELRRLARSKGLDPALLRLGERAALRRLTAESKGVLDALEKLESEALPPADEESRTVRERVLALTGAMRRVGDALLARYPRFLLLREIEDLYRGDGGGRTKAGTIAGMLAKRHGIPLESHRQLRRADPAAADAYGQGGYRLRERPI